MPQVKISNLLDLKISAIIKGTHLKFAVVVLIVSREGMVSQILYLGTSFEIYKMLKSLLKNIS